MKTHSAKFIKTFLTSKKFEPLRYLIVGGTCSLSHIIFLYLLTDVLGLFYLYSTMSSFIFVSCLGYFGQKYFTYRNFETNHAKQFSLYITIIIIGFILDASLMFSFVSLLNIHYLVAGITTRIIIFIMNFIWTKYVAFKRADSNNNMEPEYS